MRPGGSKPPLFLVHGIGGDVVSFSPLVSLLDAEQPVYAFQQRAEGSSTEHSPAALEALAASYIDELLAVQSGKPILLGGYSFGAIVGLEMAQQLTAKGYPVGLLAAIDESIPDPRSEGFWWPGRFLELLRNLPFWLWHEFFTSTAKQHGTRVWKMARRLWIKGTAKVPARWRGEPAADQ